MHAHAQVEPGLPELIEVEPVHTCNLRCIMCHVPYEKMSKQKLDVDRTLEHLKGVDGRWMTIGSMYRAHGASAVPRDSRRGCPTSG